MGKNYADKKDQQYLNSQAYEIEQVIMILDLSHCARDSPNKDHRLARRDLKKRSESGPIDDKFDILSDHHIGQLWDQLHTGYGLSCLPVRGLVLSRPDG